jgi:hypothetical protein
MRSKRELAEHVWYEVRTAVNIEEPLFRPPWTKALLHRVLRGHQEDCSDGCLVTLKANTGALALGPSAGTTADVWKRILVAGGIDATLTPTAAAWLTFKTGKLIEQSEDGGSTNHAIALTGEAALYSGSACTVRARRTHSAR